MRRQEILSWHSELVKAFGPPRQAVDSTELQQAYKEQDYGRMLNLIRRIFRLDTRLRLGYVNSGGSDAPAWVLLPEPMPFYGSAEFKRMKITLYIRRDFIDRCSFDQLVSTMAHELSHVLLDSVGHPLRRQEEAVDLTAMLHGYSRFFTAKSQHRIEWSLPEANSLWSRIKALLLKEDGPGLSVIKERSWVGYLSPDEIRFAQSLMR